jgi:hypothetical protein
MEPSFTHPLRLARFPDARKGRAPLAAAAMLGYVAFLLGAGVAALLGLWNAAWLRRPGLFAATLFIGVVGWCGFGVAALGVLAAGVESPDLALLAGRLVGIASGIALAVLHARHLRGHAFLDGATIPLLPAVLLAFGLAVLAPRRLIFLALGFWPVLFAK